MPLNPAHHRNDSNSHSHSHSTYSYPRASMAPPNTSSTFQQSHYQTQAHPHHQHQHQPMSSSASGSVSMSAAKARQYAQLQTQLAQLNANLADTQNLLRMTAVQAGDMRFLGGYMGALFMGSAKVLGEEGVKGKSGSGEGAGEAIVKKEDSEED
ncbi:hypothetical protein N7539_004774 [Penicillium diatomitis]|uniref:DASH complex subunit Hsk3 like-domain-containing protein n=1 Tax=Penicillium diatomitis TaxID=2819901 RepID=A0A9X0BUF7_9EURO|nr:uncharacterized protein N7539_004774 [Penicillium diatomitis]KAJ5484786.1 hypothetical protein N7539_004774 [Penicillium diatomitis]